MVQTRVSANKSAFFVGRDYWIEVVCVQVVFTQLCKSTHLSNLPRCVLAERDAGSILCGARPFFSLSCLQTCFQGELRYGKDGKF